MIPRSIALPFELRQFGHGQSNPTYYLVAADKKRYVLRKKPPGQLVSKTAHNVNREFRVQQALGHTPVPVAQVYCFCNDNSVIGTDFYIMEFLQGRIFEDASLKGVGSKSAKRDLWEAAIKTLAALHNVKFEEVGLADYGPKTDYYPRQAKSLARVSRAQAAVKSKTTGQLVGDIVGLDQLVAWYNTHCPTGALTITHGDYKTDNLIYHPEESKVIGILDWELSTLGHPLADLAHLLMPFWSDQSKQDYGPNGLTDQERAELPPMDELVQLYAAERGSEYPPKGWEAAKSFACYRFAVICQGMQVACLCISEADHWGSAARHATGNASSANAAKYAALFPALADQAWRCIKAVDPGMAIPSKL